VLLLASAAYVCTTVAIGTLISTMARNQQQSTMAGFLFLFPAILLSGLMFPIENMPDVMRWASYVDPLTHYLALLRNIMLKGGEAGFVVAHVAILFAMAVVLIVASFRRFRTTLQ
jgi:ABC-2 type transport system permease protein